MFAWRADGFKVVELVYGSNFFCSSCNSPDDPPENGRFAAHIGAMTEGPKFHSKMVKNWTVTVATGYGPFSYVGDFDHWISINSKDWPHPVDKRQNDPQTPQVSLPHW